MTRTASVGPRRLAVLLAALALVARMLVPVGFMPASRGPFALVACPDAGPVIHAMAMPGMTHGHDGAPQADHRCPFGAVAAAIALADAPPITIARPPRPQSLQATLPAVSRPGLGLAAPPPPKTGPPPPFR